MLFKIFGIVSHTPYLIASMICNLIFAFCFLRFIHSVKLPKIFYFLAGPLVLIIPYGAHTIFWLAASVNLVVIGLILLFMTLTEKRTVIWCSFLFLFIGIGMGGYGILLVFGVIITNLIQRRYKLTLYTSLVMIFLLIIYTNSQKSDYSYLTSKFPLWIINSELGLINSFSPKVEFPNLITIGIQLILIGGFSLLIILIKNKFQFYNLNNFDLRRFLMHI